MFREAVEAKDLDTVDTLLAEDVVFRSPVAHTPYPGKAITSAILREVVEVFEDFRYVRQLRDGSEEAYVSRPRSTGSRSPAATSSLSTTRARSPSSWS